MMREKKNTSNPKPHNTKQKPKPTTKNTPNKARPFLSHLKVFPLQLGETCEKDYELTRVGRHERTAAKPVKVPQYGPGTFSEGGLCRRRRGGTLRRSPPLRGA